MNQKKNLNSFILVGISLVLIVVSIFLIRLAEENKALKANLADQQRQAIQLREEISSYSLENGLLMRENKELNESVQKWTQEFNETNSVLSQNTQAGDAKPDRTGISPQFTMVSRGGFDRSRRQDILNDLSQGSYQDQKEEVLFDINDVASWPYLGNWEMTRYTATVGECDANPSVTASGKLVTPGFTVAVDPRYWKYGTIFYFKGLGFGVAADCGGAIKGRNRADFLTASKTFDIPDFTDVFLVYEPS